MAALPRVFPYSTILSLTRRFVSSLGRTEARDMAGGRHPSSVSAPKEDQISVQYKNRNPRNFELLGMARKPRGFGTRPWRVDYYHRLILELTLRHTTGYVNHNNGLKVLEATTKEFAISRHLYKRNNISAAYNIGRVLADRCKESGIYRLMWEHKKDRRNPKVKAFIKAFKEAGVILNEPKVRTAMPPPGELPA